MPGFEMETETSLSVIKDPFVMTAMKNSISSSKYCGILSST